MTYIRTYPPNTLLVNKRQTVTRDNFGICYITVPLEWSSSSSAYGYTADLDHRVEIWGYGEPAISAINHYDYSGYVRIFRPFATQLWNKSALHKTGGLTGTFNGVAPSGKGVFGELLLTLDFWHQKNQKVVHILGLHNPLSPMSYWGDIQITQAHEDNIKAYLEALLTDTTTSPLGYTYANHPALAAIEVANEATGDATTAAWDPLGNVKANTVRIAAQIYNHYRTSGLAVTVIGVSGVGGIQSQYLAMYGGDASSQAATSMGTVAVSGTTCTLAGHGRSVGDVVLLEATGFQATNFNGTTDYYVVNMSGSTYQLSLTSGGAAITDTVTDLFEVYKLSGTNNWTQVTANTALFDNATDVFTQTAHGLVNTNVVRLRPVPNATGTALGANLVKKYYVKTVTDANNFIVSLIPNGTAATFTAGNLKMSVITPSATYSDDGVGRFFNDYCALSHHHYGSTASHAQMTAADNLISYRNVTIDQRALYIGYTGYKNFGGRFLGTASAALDDFVTFQYDVGVANGRKVKFYGTIAAGLSKSITYYMTASDRGNRKCKLCTTYADAIAGTNIVDITGTAAAMSVLIMHPWFDESDRPKQWDTEFNLTVSAGNGVYPTKLSLTDKKALLLRWFLPSLMATSDGSGGLGTAIAYAADWAGYNGGATTVTGTPQSITSNGGFLQITLKAGTPTYPISTNERICIRTGANPIVGTNETIAASSYKLMNITTISGASLNVLDTDFPYTGGAVAGLTYTLERNSGPGINEWAWFINLMTNNLTSAVVNFGWIEYPSSSYMGIMLHIEGVGVWYTTDTGELKQW